jgi:hypothetical protein
MNTKYIKCISKNPRSPILVDIFPPSRVLNYTTGSLYLLPRGFFLSTSSSFSIFSTIRHENNQHTVKKRTRTFSYPLQISDVFPSIIGNILPGCCPSGLERLRLRLITLHLKEHFQDVPYESNSNFQQINCSSSQPCSPHSINIE